MQESHRSDNDQSITTYIHNRTTQLQTHPPRSITLVLLLPLRLIGCMYRRSLTLLSKGTTSTAMGFTKTVLKAGNGSLPQRGQQVTVHCTGYGKNNDLTQKFWSTKDPGQEPFTFAVGLGQVIKGWDEGVIGMSLGEVAKIHW